MTSLEIYTNNFVMGPKGGRVDGTFFGEDINGFSREQLLAVVDFLGEQLNWERKMWDRQGEFREFTKPGFLR